MTNSNDPSLSRRKWLGLAAGASLGSGLLALTGTAEAQTKSPAKHANDAHTAHPTHAHPTSDHNLGANTYNIRDFGAKGDGVTLDTAAVQAAIDACNKDQGGTVLVPAGVFVIGTIEMKSNVTLHIAAAGKLMGTVDGKQYHAADAIPLSGDSTLGDGNVGLIFAVKAENFTIEGPGTIDGQGAQFRSPTRGVPPPSGRGGNNRPYHLLFHQCKNFTVRNIYMFQSAYHSIRIIQSSYMQLDGIRIYNRVNHNNDGFHFISAQHVRLSNCTVECQDDACALFGSCKFVTVTNCSFSTRWSVFRFGGGEAENITVSNCLIYETYGCPVKMRCGPGSRFENISFSNLVMNKVTGPISIGVGGNRRRAPQTEPQTQSQTQSPSNAQPGSQPTAGTGAQIEDSGTAPVQGGIVRNITFSGIRATVTVPVQFPDVPFTSGYNPGEIKSCIAVNRAAEGVLENITFNDVQVTFAGGGTAEEAAVRDVPKITGEYYENGVLPAYGLYARNVHALTLSNVRFEVSSPELRPAVVFDHVEDASVNGFSAQANPQAESLLRFIETRDVLLTAARVLTPAAVFLQVEGAGSQGITVDGGDLSKAATPVAFKADASQKSVKLRD
ncbi:MAG TPA: glycosyl hydrolase family 28 protein [Terriglobales bacterium]|nr:glycosyl hydrolase family 28 protein [Terriglobales bacterium]